MEIRQISNKSYWVKGKKEGILVNPDEEIFNGNKFLSRVVIYLGKDGQKTSEKRVVLAGSGEYEIGGIDITGISSGNDEVIYLATVDGITVGVFPTLDEELSDKKIERVDSLDVMMYQIGGKVPGKTVIDWAKKWGVNYLVLINGNGENAGEKEILDLTDVESVEPVEVLKVDKEELPDGLEVVRLKW